MINRNSSITFKFLYLSVILTVLSQILQYSQYTKPLMYLMWVLTMMMVLLDNHFKIRTTTYMRRMVLGIIIIGVECLFVGIIKSNSAFFPSNYLTAICIPLFIYIVGVQIGCTVTAKHIQKIMILYCVSAIILGTYLLVTYIPSMSEWKESLTYAYAGKNAAAQILCSSAFILLFGINSEKNLLRIIKTCLAGYLIVVPLLLQCRTAMLGMCLAFFVYFMLGSTSWKKKVLLCIGIAVAIVVVLNNQQLLGYIRHALFLDKYQGANLDTFSSGRLTLYKEAFQVINENLFFGVGTYYVDGFYISIIAALGLFGAIIFYFLWFGRFYKNIKLYRSRKIFDNKTILLILMSFFYFVESLFEGYPPFGPGACAFMFWLLCGIGDSEELFAKE